MFMSDTRLAEALAEHERKHTVVERRRGAAKRFNQEIDAEINAGMAAVREETGFVDWYNTDVTQGFHVYTDDELADILKHKATRDVHSYLPILKMFFYQSISAKNIEVDLNNTLHHALKWELDFLDRETGKDRKNALTRIRSIAKKMGMKVCKGTDGRRVLATDIRMLWRDENGLISG